MEYLKQVLSQLSDTVRRMSTSQVVMLVAIVAGTIVGAVAVAGWIGKVNYQPLYTNLEATEAADITQYLAEKKIPYQIGPGGTSIEVPEKDLYTARLGLASQGLPHSGTVGYSIFDQTNLGMTDFLQKLNYRRALEGELGKTISSLREVQTARVHIVIPEERLFADQQQETTASVVLKLKHAGTLSKMQISGITHLVASSVEGLQPGNITVVDYEGNLLSSSVGNDQLASLSNSQLEVAQTVERDLERKAQTMLDGVLGPGKSIVRVTAELNFQQYSKTSENYDPNTVAIRSEQKIENSDISSKKKTEAAEDKQDNQSTTTVTNYEVSKTVESIIDPVGQVKRLSVAVLLDGTYKETPGSGGTPEKVYQPRPQSEIDRLTAIVKNAVGYSPERNDQVEMVNIAFDKQYLTDEQQEMDKQVTRQF
ncbi:MAG: flagellar basal-body MS-ring/collar protein FliF, partial [candidate division Zixibacteria bacterium]|nr:flagellar basal-body MS-ring/collar protein FliF [candidate division Zixibacteria bacterium]